MGGGGRRQRSSGKLSRHNYSPDRPRSPLPAAGGHRGGGGGGRGSLPRRLCPPRGIGAASACGSGCSRASRLGTLAVAALAVALAASIPPAILDGIAPSAPHQDRAAPGIFPGPLHLAHLLLPAAHADPHYGPCVYFPKSTDIGVGYTVVLSFVTRDGLYGIGETIVINAHRTTGHGDGEPLRHSRIALETGNVDRFAVWQENQGDDILYNYTVQPGTIPTDWPTRDRMQCTGGRARPPTSTT